jgi:hypothetical protein
MRVFKKEEDRKRVCNGCNETPPYSFSEVKRRESCVQPLQNNISLNMN